MSNFEHLIRNRYSCRQFSDSEVLSDQVQLILESALLSPTAKNNRQWQFYVTDNRLLMTQLADVKEHGASFLRDAGFAVVVACDPKNDECWIEDCSIAAITMQYQASDLGLGSCWCEIRDRYLSDGTSAEDAVRGIVGVGENERILCVIAFGHAKSGETKHSREADWQKVKIVD